MRPPVRTVSALVAALLSLAAAAQDYPSRPIRMIVPFAPGGATDVPARLIAPKLSDALGQQVVIENRAGAGGIIGIEAAAKSAPDGYTLLMATNGEFAMNPAIYPKLPYNPFRDFVPVSIVSETPMIIAVGAGSSFANLSELLAAARAKPGTVTYSTAGTGSTSHVLTEVFAAAVGIKLLHVPYKGGAPASAAVASGEVAMSLLAMSSVISFVRGGKARALAVARSQRLAAFPDWATVAEAGVRGVDESIWVGMAAPAGVPQAIVARLSAETARAVRLPDIRERFASLGSEPAGTSPEETAARIQREAARYDKVIREAGIRAD